jgi:citrate lyase beta subunit
MRGEHVELSLITDDEDFAGMAELAGIDRVMLDLETKGKAERQAGRGLFLSDHQIESVPRIRSCLKKASLVVRVNPLDEDSPEEIDKVTLGGADFIMLPFFHTTEEVRRFIKLVRRRAKTILLVETKAAMDNLADFIKEDGIDEMHIGLNDLSLSLGRKVIFEVVCDGTVDRLSAAIRAEGIPFGFGGIARLSQKSLPINPERVLAEQVKVGATRGWLGRTFRDATEFYRRPGRLAREVQLLRHSISKWRSASEEEFLQNRELLRKEVLAWAARVPIGPAVNRRVQDLVAEAAPSGGDTSIREQKKWYARRQHDHPRAR